jgi:hypothetical protein
MIYVSNAVIPSPPELSALMGIGARIHVKRPDSIRFPPLKRRVRGD